MLALLLLLILEGKLLNLQNTVDELREKLAVSQSETQSRDHDLKQVLL
jgi:hypothetical protein